MEFLAGLILVTFGVAVLLFSFGVISAVVYPILWWGIIFIIDALNFWKWKQSIIHNQTKKFFLILLPLSTLFWLYYELVNVVYPQWGYAGIISGIWIRVPLSILSFGTVIPIIVEILWFLNGPVERLPFSEKNLSLIKRYPVVFMSIGWIFLVLPLFSNNFYLNQLMWLGPLFMLLPFVSGPRESINKDFWWLAVATGLTGGFLWEFLNYWAGGKWQYIILPDAPHIFEMPVYGYIGFIPFAMSTVALYILAKNFIPSRWSAGLLLYFLAALLSYLFVILS
ncbi:MAG: hypothetical protein HZB99_02420 [Candidatus Harrisonbacteria bacterium]|nr:hypothetical protein [Candidatus Harrisonbacteria bacterium]